MNTDHVLEDLADGEQEGGSGKIDYTAISSDDLNMHEQNILIGRNSPNTRSTKTASRTKNTNKQTSGKSWYKT